MESDVVTPPQESGAISESRQARFQRADAEATRLAPNVFSNFPSAVIEELERRNCTIPQTYMHVSPQMSGNVVQGHFTEAEQIDIAVLCSRNRISSILLFRNGATSAVAEFASAPDHVYLQEIGNGSVGYSRAIAVADPERILQQYRLLGSVEPPPPVNHQGIDDAFIEKGSTIWYWHNENWLQLTGSD